MGQKYANAKCEDLTCLNLEQLKKILFHNPNNKKFVITNFSNDLKDYQRFESEVCEICRFVTFSKPLESPLVNKFKL